MSAEIKKHFSKTAKICATALFVLLMFVNLQITTNPNKNGDINLFGVKLSLFTSSAYAYGEGLFCIDIYDCVDTGWAWCAGDFVYLNGQVEYVNCYYIVYD